MSLFRGNNFSQPQQQYYQPTPEYQPTTKELIIARGKKLAKCLGIAYGVVYIIMDILMLVFTGELIGLGVTLAIASGVAACWLIYMVVVAIGSIWIKD